MFAYLTGLRTISPKALQQRRQEAGPVTIIDVNSRQSWVTNHVPGAIHLDPVAYTEEDLPADTDAMLVFYCSNPMCMKAPTAARRAKKMNHANVHIMPAGISGWIAAELPTESAG